jgi:hypothetical protein
MLFTGANSEPLLIMWKLQPLKPAARKYSTKELGLQ